MTEENQEGGIPLLWQGPEELPILFANQFVSQFYQDAFIVTVGQTVPPPIVGTDVERAKQLVQVSYVSVKPVARLSLTRTSMRDLIAHLEANLQQYEEAQLAKGGEEGWPNL